MGGVGWVRWPCKGLKRSGSRARDRKALASPADARDEASLLCEAACGKFTEKKV